VDFEFLIKLKAFAARVLNMV